MKKFEELTEEEKNYIREHCNDYNPITFEHKINIGKVAKFLRNISIS